ncbi:MAG: RpiB/LacA/LacB family sugar-phosphate isomerase [Eubacterium sp.]|nr:RpiB/LacA/LacB family sugar-phosphate isomerase [Eubacterium sp.]
MKISIGSDKSGYALRKTIERYLYEKGCDVKAYGPTDSETAVPFFEVAPLVAGDIQNGDAELGILICGTGMGMAQVAGKFEGVRAACCESTYAAKMCRVINDSNVLCMGGWIIADTLGTAMTEEFLNAEFTVGVEERRKAWLENAKSEFKSLEEEIYK